MMLANATPPPAMRCYATIERAYPADKHLRRLVHDGDYAATEWSATEGGGGESVLVHRHGRWCMVTSGGGALGVDEFVRAGVPRSVAQRLYAKLRYSQLHATPFPQRRP